MGGCTASSFVTPDALQEVVNKPMRAYLGDALRFKSIGDLRHLAQCVGGVTEMAQFQRVAQKFFRDRQY